jgi:cytochrome P450
MGIFKILAGTLAVVFVLRAIFLRVYRRLELAKISRSQNCALPPRIPSRDPFFGTDTVLEIFSALQNNVRIKKIVSQHQKYGMTFESFPFGRRVISTVDARNIQVVLSTQHEKFGVGPVREGATGPMLGKGIIASDGENWMHGRAMIKPTFMRSQIADRVVFEGFVGRFLEMLDGEGKVVDLQPLFDRLVSWI